MRYALLIYGDESASPAPEGDESQSMLERYYDLTKNLNERGINRGGEALDSIATATTVRVRNGEVLTTDGPFAETKEQLGGFYLIDVDDLDAALEVAARIPTAEYGCVEVRPVWEVPER